MAITISGSGIVEANLADNAVTLAKMASGTDGEILTYDASGNPVAVSVGTDGQVLTSTGAGSPPAFEAAAAGGISDLSPYWHGMGDGSYQTVSRGSWTYLTTGTEIVDSDLSFDGTTFTCPSGEAGIYYIYAGTSGNTALAGNDTEIVEIYFNVNGVMKAFSRYATGTATDYDTPISIAATVSLSVGHTVKIHGRIYDANDSGTHRFRDTWFGGFKIG